MPGSEIEREQLGFDAKVAMGQGTSRSNPAAASDFSGFLAASAICAPCAEWTGNRRSVFIFASVPWESRTYSNPMAESKV
jgi:hypothetical protein